MTLINGKKLAAKRQASLKTKINNLSSDQPTPCLAVVMVGEDPSSVIYVQHKEAACQAVGITSRLIQLPISATEEELITAIEQLNQDQAVDAILLQFPLPAHLDEIKFMSLIAPEKDVDGFNFQNQGRLLQNQPTIVPCTPLGVIELLKEYNLPVKGKNVCVVGTSNIVGKPLGIMLLNMGATVDFCHQLTTNLAEHTVKADILISAVGHPGLITKEMVKPEAIVIDIGISKERGSRKVFGDVEFDQVKALASYITPVPGGVGPMTVQMLLENTFKLYQLHQETC